MTTLHKTGELSAIHPGYTVYYGDDATVVVTPADNRTLRLKVSQHDDVRAAKAAAHALTGRMSVNQARETLQAAGIAL